MVNLNLIKDKKLRDLVKASKKFQSLTEEEQQAEIKKISHLPLRQQKELITFFETENQKDLKGNNNQAKLLMDFLVSLEDLKKKLTALVQKDMENKEKKEEVKMTEDILNQLNKI